MRMTRFVPCVAQFLGSSATHTTGRPSQGAVRCGNLHVEPGRTLREFDGTILNVTRGPLEERNFVDRMGIRDREPPLQAGPLGVSHSRRDMVHAAQKFGGRPASGGVPRRCTGIASAGFRRSGVAADRGEGIRVRDPRRRAVRGGDRCSAGRPWATMQRCTARREAAISLHDRLCRLTS